MNLSVTNSSLEDPLNNHDRYEFIRWASSDSRHIFIARDRRVGHTVQVKVFPRGPSVTESVSRELLHHYELDHTNVAALFEAFLTPHHMCIIMETGESNLWKHVHGKGGRLDEMEAQCFFVQLLNGVKYCHANGVVNRDITMDTSLIQNIYQSGKQYPVVKICDFGYCKNMMTDSMPKSFVGTAGYLCYDVVQANMYEPETTPYRGEPVDVWICGVILYYLLEGIFPFGTEHDAGGLMGLVGRIQSLQYFPCNYASVGAQDLFAKIFCQPEFRLTLDGVLDHWWVRQATVNDNITELLNLANPPSRDQYRRMNKAQLKQLIDDARAPIETQDQDIDDEFR